MIDLIRDRKRTKSRSRSRSRRRENSERSSGSRSQSNRLRSYEKSPRSDKRRNTETKRDAGNNKPRRKRRSLSDSDSSSSSSDSSSGSSSDSSGSSTPSSLSSRSLSPEITRKPRPIQLNTGDVDLRKTADLDLRARLPKKQPEKAIPVRTSPIREKIRTPPITPSEPLTPPQPPKRVSDPEEGEIQTDEGSRKLSHESKDSQMTDDDKDLATLIQERFPINENETMNLNEIFCEKDASDSDNSDTSSCTESEDALAHSPIDPIAGFVEFENVNEARTPSDAPGTPNSSDDILEKSQEESLTALELDEVNWELFKSDTKVAYFRPLIGKSHFFHQPSLEVTSDDLVERSPFMLRTPESEPENEQQAAEMMAMKIFYHAIDEIMLELAFEIMGEILEERIQNQKEALKTAFIENTLQMILENEVSQALTEIFKPMHAEDMILNGAIDKFIDEETDHVIQKTLAHEKLTYGRLENFFQDLMDNLIQEDVVAVIWKQETSALRNKEILTYGKVLRKHRNGLIKLIFFLGSDEKIFSKKFIARIDLSSRNYLNQ